MCPTVLLEAGSEMVWGVFHLKQLEILMLFGGVLDRDQSSKLQISSVDMRNLQLKQNDCQSIDLDM